MTLGGGTDAILFGIWIEGLITMVSVLLIACWYYNDMKRRKK
jgi:hypothetical protein